MRRWFVGWPSALVALSLLSWLSLADMGRAQFSDKLTTTPLILQDLQGPVGTALPYNGLSFCCPVGVAMSMSYLGINGFNQFGPANPTAADNLNLVRVLAGLQNTDPLEGTFEPAFQDGIGIYLALKGIGTSSYTLVTHQAPTVANLGALNQPGTAITLIGGGYTTGNDRYFGHCVTLVGQGINALGQASPNTLVIKNPAPSAFAPQADVPANGTQYLNTIATTGNFAAYGAIALDPAQYPGYWGTDRLVIEEAIVLTVNPSQKTANNPIAATWSISTLQQIRLNNATFTALAPVTGTGGLTISGGGLFESTAPNTTTGFSTVIGSHWRSTITSGVPFGTNSMRLRAGTLEVAPAAGSSAVSLTSASGSGSTFNYNAGSQVLLNRNGHSTLTFTVGGVTDNVNVSLLRNAASHGTLVIAPASGIAALGSLEKLIVRGTGGNLPALTNGMASATIVARDNDALESGDFLSYGANGFVKAAYTLGTMSPIASAGVNAVFDANSTQTIPNGAITQVYALKVGAVAITGGVGSELRIGPGSGEAGLILNGGTIDTGTLRFGNGEGQIYTSKAGGVISSVIVTSGAGFTSFGPGTLTLQGASTYTGGTFVNTGTLEAKNTSGSATGTGLVTVQQPASLKISGALGQAGGTGGITVESGADLLLNGGTASGTLTVESGAHLYGSGKVTGSATVSGTIGGSGDDLSHDPFTGVENITFSGPTTTFDASTIYSWRLNALDDTPADAGTDWSLLTFTGATRNMGTSGNAFNWTFDLAANLADPNSGAGFWNQNHRWLAATAPSGFNNIWYYYNTPAFTQGDFALSTDAQFKFLYVNYTASIPEPGVFALLICGAGLALRRRRDLAVRGAGE